MPPPAVEVTDATVDPAATEGASEERNVEGGSAPSTPKLDQSELPVTASAAGATLSPACGAANDAASVDASASARGSPPKLVRKLSAKEEAAAAILPEQSHPCR